MYDFLIVGSGCSAAMAAQTLVESGAKILMLDVGVEETRYTKNVSPSDFLTNRRTDQNQHEYFLGKDQESIGWGSVGKGEQITAPRKYITSQTEELTPVTEQGFSVFESLAYGGLGVGWGVGAWKWSSPELDRAGLNAEVMDQAYQTVADRIGISGTKDSAQAYTVAGLKGLQKSAKADTIHSKILQRFTAHRARYEKQGFYVGRAPLALLTEDKGTRKKYDYTEMDFYSDKGKSAYRPWITIDALKKRRNFTYINGKLVTNFKETADAVTVTCIDTRTSKSETFKARKLILCAGVFGTARIVLRSLDPQKKATLPLLCNPYSYLPCIVPGFLGMLPEKKKLSFAQLSAFLDEDGQNTSASMASLYGYRSLMLYRMVRQVPLNFSDARSVLQYLTPSLLIMGIHHPDNPSPTKFVQLKKSASSPTNDHLFIHYELSAEEKELKMRREKKYTRFVRKLGVFPLKKFDLTNGASIHYAGTLPFRSNGKKFTLQPSGKLNATRNVFVADASGFTYLPAKGLTFSIMANAHRIALEALHD
jgi:choline dehydrogenase-like flavoprotein